MALIRAIVCSAALAVALAPLGALAADTSTDHLRAEVANSDAQFDLAQKQVADLVAQANLAAANERMIMLLRSQDSRARQLNLSANANAMEEIATALANAAVASGNMNARNSLAIAQIQATTMVAKADDTLSNALAQGRPDEIANARAQGSFLRQLADLITGNLAQQNMSNDKLIAQTSADSIHAQTTVQSQNQIAMGANELLAADVFLATGNLNAISATLSVQDQVADILARADASRANERAKARAAGVL
jgi:hypothetical protein